ncbi:aminoacyl-tRNA hydrolase [Anaeromassilibacillus senegalensis]|uniref:Peptidyl-tRNA hydrolase n=1 Tax=Anaeromassilibacillus senegalensis TaxID=1673717 RepID=A0ABS9CMD5_9FIRM|nr:aminoacyl-tRNA hydrolase [Anaeromassilibacillus senegalensis]MCF2652327.1 aminoacyl-tRNA hydrolase [Anaeromassilibacillus senegalensis]
MLKLFSKNEVPSGADWLIVGLGNPGPKYDGTRHNTGFLMIDALAEHFNCEVRRVKFKGLYGKCKIAGQDVVLLKPSTFMNLSGQSVTDAMNFFHLPPERVLLLFDDISLDVGKTRIRLKGSDGGHNGVKNIIYLSGSDRFPRMKIGIGHKPEGWDLADWVLSRFSKDEMKLLAGIAENVIAAAELILGGQADKAMNRFNS